MTNPIPPELVARLRRILSQCPYAPAPGLCCTIETTDLQLAIDALEALINPSPLDREAVARIIEPYAWTFPEGFDAAVSARMARRESLKIADAIIALLLAHPVEPQPVQTEAMGTEASVTLSLGGRDRDIDASIAPIVAALNAAGVATVASCSGHGNRPANIALADGRECVIARNFDEARLIDGLFPVGANGEGVQTGGVEAHLRHVIDRDRYAAAIVLNNFRVLLRGWDWLRGPSRGCYEYDDATYQLEFGAALDAFEAAIGPLAKLAWDKTDCTVDPDKVAEASVAGRLRASELAAPTSLKDGPYGPYFDQATPTPVPADGALREAASPDAITAAIMRKFERMGGLPTIMESANWSSRIRSTIWLGVFDTLRAADLSQGKGAGS